MAGRKGRSGRPPKSRDQKVFYGAFGVDGDLQHGSVDEAGHANAARIQTEMTGPPPGMFAEGKKVWKRAVEDLERAGIARVSADLLQTYCNLMADVRWAEAQLKRGRVIKYPNGTRGINPAFQVRKDALSQMTKLANELCLTPAVQLRMQGYLPGVAKPYGGRGSDRGESEDDGVRDRLGNPV